MKVAIASGQHLRDIVVGESATQGGSECKWPVSEVHVCAAMASDLGMLLLNKIIHLQAGGSYGLSYLQSRSLRLGSNYMLPYIRLFSNFFSHRRGINMHPL